MTRVLGANTRPPRIAQLSEFVAIGLLADFTGAIAASLLFGVIATQVFDLTWTPTGASPPSAADSASLP